MSVQALSCAMVLRGVSASEKLLLLVLANYADENMSCWPSHKRLSEDACLSQRTILTLLKGLEERRIITRRERFRRDGSRTTDLITIYFSGEVVSPPHEDGDTPPTQSTAGGGARISPLTTFEPSVNHHSEPSPLVALSAPPTKRSLKRVPESWSPSERTLQALADEGHDAETLERSLTRMRDHEFATARSDWDAAFRNWVRRDADLKPRTRHDQRHANPSDPTARENRLGRMLRGAMAAVDEREHELERRRSGTGG